MDNQNFQANESCASRSQNKKILQDLRENSDTNLSKVFICHRLPERTFKIRNHYFPVCSRCTGIYIGAFSYYIFVYFVCIQHNFALILMALQNLSKIKDFLSTQTRSVWCIESKTFECAKTFSFCKLSKSKILTRQILCICQLRFSVLEKLSVLQPEKLSIFPCPKHKVFEAALMMLPAFSDDLTQFFGSKESNNTLRFSTGLIAVIGLGILVKSVKYGFLY